MWWPGRAAMAPARRATSPLHRAAPWRCARVAAWLWSAAAAGEVSGGEQAIGMQKLERKREELHFAGRSCDWLGCCCWTTAAGISSNPRAQSAAPRVVAAVSCQAALLPAVEGVDWSACGSTLAHASNCTGECSMGYDRALSGYPVAACSFGRLAVVDGGCLKGGFLHAGLAVQGRG